MSSFGLHRERMTLSQKGDSPCDGKCLPKSSEAFSPNACNRENSSRILPLPRSTISTYSLNMHAKPCSPRRKQLLTAAEADNNVFRIIESAEQEHSSVLKRVSATAAGQKNRTSWESAQDIEMDRLQPSNSLSDDDDDFVEIPLTHKSFLKQPADKPVAGVEMFSKSKAISRNSGAFEKAEVDCKQIIKVISSEQIRAGSNFHENATDTRQEPSRSISRSISVNKRVSSGSPGSRNFGMFCSTTPSSHSRQSSVCLGESIRCSPKETENACTIIKGHRVEQTVMNDVQAHLSSTDDDDLLNVPLHDWPRVLPKRGLTGSADPKHVPSSRKRARNCVGPQSPPNLPTSSKRLHVLSLSSSDEECDMVVQEARDNAIDISLQRNTEHLCEISDMNLDDGDQDDPSKHLECVGTVSKIQSRVDIYEADNGVIVVNRTPKRGSSGSEAVPPEVAPDSEWLQERRIDDFSDSSDSRDCSLENHSGEVSTAPDNLSTSVNVIHSSDGVRRDLLNDFLPEENGGQSDCSVIFTDVQDEATANVYCGSGGNSFKNSNPTFRCIDKEGDTTKLLNLLEMGHDNTNKSQFVRDFGLLETSKPLGPSTPPPYNVHAILCRPGETVEDMIERIGEAGVVDEICKAISLGREIVGAEALGIGQDWLRSRSEPSSGNLMRKFRNSIGKDKKSYDIDAATASLSGAKEKFNRRYEKMRKAGPRKPFRPCRGGRRRWRGNRSKKL